MDDVAFSLASLPRAKKSHHWLNVTPRSEGSWWRLPVLTVTGVEPGPTLLVTAAVHGDEYEGVETIPNIFAQVEPESIRGNLVMVPICNVPAYESTQRSSPIDGLNLARVFPGDPQGTITQQIAHVISEQLIQHADFYIDLHSGGLAADIPTLIGYIHDEGELGQRSLAGATAFGAPVLWGHPLPVPPGRTISAATDFGVPSLYTEAPGGGYAREDDVACFTQGVLNVMIHLGMLDGEPNPRPMTHHLVGDGNLDTVINAPVAGYFRAEVSLLDEVQQGDQLGVIRDVFGQLQAIITADADGIVIMIRRLHRVDPGDGLIHLTEQIK